MKTTPVSRGALGMVRSSTPMSAGPHVRSAKALALLVGTWRRQTWGPVQVQFNEERWDSLVSCRDGM